MALASPLASATGGTEVVEVSTQQGYVIPEEVSVKILQASAYGDLDPKDRNTLHRQFNRLADTGKMPTEAVARWAEAKKDRSGLAQISFLKEWAKNPGFGQAVVRESQSASAESETTYLYKWVERQTLLLEKRQVGLDEEAASAAVEAELKGAPWRAHPTFPKDKSRRLFRVFAGLTDRSGFCYETKLFLIMHNFWETVSRVWGSRV